MLYVLLIPEDLGKDSGHHLAQILHFAVEESELQVTAMISPQSIANGSAQD